MKHRLPQCLALDSVTLGRLLLLLAQEWCMTLFLMSWWQRGKYEKKGGSYWEEQYLPVV